MSYHILSSHKLFSTKQTLKLVLTTAVVEDRIQNSDRIAMGNYLSSEPVESSPQTTENHDVRHSQNLKEPPPPSYLEATRGNKDLKSK